MASKEWLDKTLSLCSCTGFPDGKHGPHCHTTVAADLLDEAIRAEAEWWVHLAWPEIDDEDASEDDVSPLAKARLAQLREGKT